MKKVISLIITLCLIMSVVVFAPLASVEAASATQGLNWQRIKTIKFTEAEETAGVFRIYDNAGAVADEDIKDELATVSFPSAEDGGGIRIEKKKACTLMLDIADISGTTENYVKVGVRYKSNSTADIFRFTTKKASGNLNTIFANGPALRYSYRNSYGNKILDYGFDSVTEDVKDAAFIFDIAGGTYTPVFNGEELCAPYARKNDMARPASISFTIGLPYTTDPATYVQIMEVYVEQGFDAGYELTEELILDENESSSAVTKDLNFPSFLNENDESKKASVTYTSSNPSVITNSGQVIPGALDETVKITAEINYQGQISYKEFTFTVLKESLPYDTNWKRVMSVKFTAEDEANGVYSLSIKEGNVDDILNVERASDGEGLIITKNVDTDSTNIPTLTIEDPEEIIKNGTANIVKVGARFKFKSSDDGFRFRTYRSAGYLATIFATNTRFRWSYTSSYGNKIHEVDFAESNADTEFDAAYIIDITNGTLTPVLNGEKLCDPFKSSYAVRPVNSAFELNFPCVDGNYVQIMEYYVEEGFDAGKDLNASALLGGNAADDKITEDLELVTVLNEGTSEEATVTYESSNPAVIGNDGSVTRGEVSEVVYLTAEINYEGQLTYKKFKYIVLADGLEDNYLSIEDEDFKTNPIGYEFTQNGGKASYLNGKLCLTREKATGALSAERYFVSGLKENPYSINGEEILFETFINLNDHIEAGTLTLRDENDAELSTVSVAKEDGVYVFKYTSKEGTSEGVSVSGGKDLYIRYILDTVNDTFKIFVDNEEIDGAVEKETVSGGSISSVKYEATEGASGSLLVDSVKLLYRTDDKELTAVTLDSENLKITDITSQDPEYISEDLKYLPVRPFGSTAQYVILTETDAVDSYGVVTRPAEDVTVSLKVILTNGSKTTEKFFDFVIKGANPMDIALNQLTYSSQSVSGHGAGNAVDYLYNTAWISSSDNAYLTVALEDVTTFNKIVLREAEIDGSYPITSFNIEVSDNNRTWTTVSAGTSVGEVKEILFDPTESKYIRFLVNAPSGESVGLNELEIYYEPAPEDAVLVDKNEVTLPDAYVVTEDLTFITECTYGSTVEWISSYPGIISNTGELVDIPDKDTVVTLTAIITNGTASYTKIFKKMVEGDGGSGNGGSGGSGSGSGGSGGGGGKDPGDKSPVGSVDNPGTVPTPSQDENIPAHAVTFDDVASDRWSEEYISELASAGIIAGDGNGKFRPTDRVSREEFLKMLVVALSLDTENVADSNFSDVTDGAWYKEYVDIAISLGIVNGVSADRFGAGAPITRQDMAVMTVRALSAAGITLDGSNAMTFADESEISIYAMDGVNVLVVAGIINGSDGKFLPNDNLTREQAAKIIALVRRVNK